jgi:hypothetical protein
MLFSEKPEVFLAQPDFFNHQFIIVFAAVPSTGRSQMPESISASK